MLETYDYETSYAEAMTLMGMDDSIKTLNEALGILKLIPNDVKNVEKDINDCEKRLSQYEKYYTAKNLSVQDVIEEMEKAIDLLSDCLDYKDAKELMDYCVNKKNELEKEEEQNNELIYNECLKLYESNNLNDLEEAINKIRDIKSYKDANELYITWLNKRRQIIYHDACSLIEKNTIDDLEEAVKKLLKIKGYKDVDILIRNAQRKNDSIVIDSLEKGKWKKKAVLYGIFGGVVLILFILTLI